MDFELNNILKKLKDIRQDLDLNQTEIADKIGIKQGVYSRWESGREMIPMRRLNSFANITGYTIDYIMGLSVTNKKNSIIKEINLIECGERLRKWRKASGVTQKSLADFLNTTQSTISAYESGKVLILTSFAYQISKKYRVSIDWLLSRSDDMRVKE